MAKPSAPNKPNINDGVSQTVMAIRENLMEYYKGTCIERLTTTNVRLETARGSYNHHFERDDAQVLDERVLKISNIPIAQLTKEPEALVIFLATLERSKSFRAIKEAVEAFMAKHLPGVAVERSKAGSKSGWQGDRALILSNATILEQDERYEYVTGKLTNALNATLPYAVAPNGEEFRDNSAHYVRINNSWLERRERSQTFTLNSLDTIFQSELDRD